MLNKLSCTQVNRERFHLMVSYYPLMQAVCPFCSEPSDLQDDDVALQYFAKLDILLKVSTCIAAFLLLSSLTRVKRNLLSSLTRVIFQRRMHMIYLYIYISIYDQYLYISRIYQRRMHLIYIYIYISRYKHKVRSNHRFQLSFNVVLGCCVQSEIKAKSQTKPNAYLVLRPLF